MKRFMLGVAALALLLVATETASARPWYGVSAGYGWGGPYYGASYGTRVGNNGFLSVGIGSGWGGYGYYPSYGYSYAAPAYYSAPVVDATTYVAPAAATYVAPTYYYSTPSYYYSTPAYYGPSIGFSYYRGGWGGYGHGYRHWR